MLIRIILLALVCSVTQPITLRAQSLDVWDNANASSGRIDDFLDQARLAAERFRNADEATLAGYRLLGPDFPGMGYHWVNSRHVGAGLIDPQKPSVLTYLEVDGEPILTGIAFALAVRSEGQLPAFPWPGAWHVHHGTVDEETLLLNPASRLHGNGGSWSLAMLHAWVFTENPDGVFAQDNWALPFYRAGLTPPTRITPQQGKALHLITGGEAYYLRLIETAVTLNDTRRKDISEILTQNTELVRKLVGQLKPGAAPTQNLMRQLDAIWSRLWRDIRVAVGDDVWSEIKMLSG